MLNRQKIFPGWEQNANMFESEREKEKKIEEKGGDEKFAKYFFIFP